MESRPKVTKEVLCEEARFILANVLAESRYGQPVKLDSIRRVCEGAVSIPFAEYMNFLGKAGYLAHDRHASSVGISDAGEAVVGGANLGEFTDRAVAHFKRLRQTRHAATSHGTGAGASVATSATSAETPRTPFASGTMSPPLVAVAPIVEASREVVKTVREARPAGVARGSVPPFTDEHQFEKLARIGAGGIGTVFRARQVSLHREVAFKEIKELFGLLGHDRRSDIVRRFAEAIRAQAALTHPHVLPIYDVFAEAEHPYVIAELAVQGSCRRLIADAEALPMELVFRYLLQTLQALRAAHQKQLFHRGLKPEQLLLDASGNIKVSDFGLARVVEHEASMRQMFVGLGNVAYMAPELYADPTQASAGVDIYALGIIFYELIARKLPARRSPMPSQVRPGLPKGVDDIFDLMTKDEPGERYATIDDVLADLDKVEGLEPYLSPTRQWLGGDTAWQKVSFRPGAEDPVAGTEIK